MLLDERLLEGRGDAIARRVDQIFARRLTAAVLALLVAMLLPADGGAQRADDSDRVVAAFKQAWPDVHARLVALERAQGVFIGALAAGKGPVDEPAVLQRMTQRTAARSGTGADAEADSGYATLGPRGAEVVTRTHAFYREVVAIIATTPPADRHAALDAALTRYSSRSDVALPDAPKDMTLLYDHPYSSFLPPEPGELEPRRKIVYPSLTGFVWAAHWYQLAAQEPLERFADTGERSRGLTLVAEKFQRKLSGGTPPDAYPSELPLAPTIAPGLVSLHEKSAAVIDNLNMMLDIVADVLVHPDVRDRKKAVDDVIAQFTQRTYRCVIADEWVLMALRHSIFQQGGPALGAMTANERNGGGGHMQHFAGRRSVTPCE